MKISGFPMISKEINRGGNTRKTRKTRYASTRKTRKTR